MPTARARRSGTSQTFLAPVRIEGRIIGLVGVNIDITERKLAEEKIRKLADHDALTGLPNGGSSRSVSSRR